MCDGEKRPGTYQYRMSLKCNVAWRSRTLGGLRRDDTWTDNGVAVSAEVISSSGTCNVCRSPIPVESLEMDSITTGVTMSGNGCWAIDSKKERLRHCSYFYWKAFRPLTHRNKAIWYRYFTPIFRISIVRSHTNIRFSSKLNTWPE